RRRSGYRRCGPAWRGRPRRAPSRSRRCTPTAAWPLAAAGAPNSQPAACPPPPAATALASPSHSVDLVHKSEDERGDRGLEAVSLVVEHQIGAFHDAETSAERAPGRVGEALA